MATDHNFRIKNGLQVGGTIRIDSAGKFYPANIQNTGPISFLNGSGAQGISVRDIYAGTTYANRTAAAGTIDALNGFKVAGTTVIDSARNLTNITTATISAGSNYVGLDISGSNSGYTAAAIKNTSSGDAILWMDASNGDLSGSDYASVRQNNALELVLRTESSAAGISLQTQGAQRFRVSSGGTLERGSSNTATLTQAGHLTVATGAVSGKFAVMNTGVHGSYDFYNNGTTYLNGAAIVDDHLSITGGNAQLSVAGNINVATNIRHMGDIDTYIQFTDGEIDFFANGVNGFMTSSGGFVVNPNAGNYDFIVKGDTDTNLIYGDASADRVGIGISTPNVKLAVDGQLSTGDRRLSLGILDLNSGSTPTQFKITTNIPFASGSADFTVNIKGFKYSTNDMVDLSIGWHYYNSTFYSASVKSSGAFAPTVTLGVENSKVVIHLASPGYWPKLYVESMYSSAYRDSYARGWSWSDAAISSDSNTPTVSPAYSIDFGNNFKMLDNGNVGIGVASPTHKLHVAGDIRINNGSALKLYNAAGNGWAQISYNNSLDHIEVQRSFQSATNAYYNLGSSSKRWGIVYSGALDVLKSGSGDATINIKSITGGDPTIVFNSAAANRSGLIKYQDNGTNVGRIEYVHNGDRIDLQAGSATGATMSIQNGQVGINVTDPLSDLHVQGSNSAILRVDAQDGGSAPAMTSRIQLYGYEGRGAGIKIRDSVNSASSANNREWFVGSGYGTGGFNIGYASNGSQSEYAAQNKLAISTSGAVTFNNTYTFPTSDGSANQVLQTNGSGQLSFATPVTLSNGANNRIVTASSASAINAEANLQFDGSALDIYTGSIPVTDNHVGLTFRQTGTYADGRYEHRFRKRDEGGGIPLYIDKTSATANAHTAIARFGSYTSNPEEFQVYGAAKVSGALSVTGTLTGTTATAAGGTNTTALASTAFVQQEITSLIGGAPSALNTLNELAAAINDDSNYNTTLTTALGTKLPKAGGTITGNLTVNNNLYIGDGNDGYFFNDQNGRTAFANGDFYIQNSVTNYYNYATNQYIGDSSGDNIYFRGNNLSGDDWAIIGSNGATAIGHSSGNMDTTNLRLQVAGNASIYAGGYLYFGITSNNQNSWKNRITGFNTSTLHINSQGVQFDNTGYANPVVVWLKANASEFSHKGNTIWHAGNDASGSGLDADLLDGQHGSYYAPKASPTFTGTVTLPSTVNGPTNDSTLTNVSTGWHTIASFGGARTASTIEFWDSESSRHNFVKAEIGWSYGHGTINILNATRHGNRTIARMRLMYNTSDQTYGGARLEVYLENWSTSYSLRLRKVNRGGRTGWGDITWAPSSGSVSGYAQYGQVIEIGSSQRGTFGTSGKVIAAEGVDIYNGNQITFHTAASDGISTERGFIDAEEGGHLRIATSGGENIVFQDGGVGGTTNLTLLGTGEMVKEATERFTIKSHSNNWTGGMRMISQDGTDTFQIHPDNNGYMYIDKNWYFANDVYIGSTTTKAWHAGNDGSGSGLDADLLDGVQGANYARLDQSNVFGAGTHSNYFRRNNVTNYTDAQLLTESYGGASTTAGIGFHISGSVGRYLYMNNTGTLYWNSSGSKIWHASNDGSGSGLDADLLDGQHASAFLTGNQTITLTGPVTGSGTTSISTSNPYQTSVTFQGSNGNSPDSAMEYTQAASVSDSRLAPTTDWYNKIRLGHGDPYNYYSNTIAVKMTGTGYGDLYTMTVSNNSTGNWNKHWHANNDGSSSGLDADLLDGQHGSYYRSASNLNAGTVPTGQMPKILPTTGNYQWSASTAASGYSPVGISTSFVRGADGWPEYGTVLHVGGRGGSDAGGDFQLFSGHGAANGGNYLRVRNADNSASPTDAWTAFRTIWDSGNDGSGSGLDADLLDGNHASAFLTNSNDRIYITDTRNASRDPSYYDDRYVQADFTQSTNLGVSGGDSWAAVLTVSKWASYDVSHRQEQLIFAGTKLARRVATSDSAWSSAHTIWDSSTDGSGSGLDADLLDGQHASAFAPIGGSTGRFITGGLYGTGHSASTLPIWQYNAGNPGYGIAYTESSPDVLRFDVSGNLLSGTADLELRPNELKVNGNTVWHAGNDGSGSGLDADLLDGMTSAANGNSIIMRTESNGYSQLNNWTQVGGAGMYSGTNGAHFYPNTAGSYGTWRINGSRGGYSGIYHSNGGAVVGGMYDSGGNGGDYNASSGWHFYYHRGNDCLGVSDSTTSSSYSLYVTGAIYATGDIVGSSDERLKTEIKTIPDALEKVNKLRGVTYRWKEEQEVNNVTETRMGVIAQEVVEVIPEVVTHDIENDRYGVSYGHMSGVLIEAVKELTQQVKDLKQEVEELKNG